MIKKSHILFTLVGILQFMQTPKVVASAESQDNILFSNIVKAEDLPSSFFSNPEEENKFTLYINQGTLSIKYNNPIELTNGEVIVYNLLGQEITRKKLENSNLNQVSLSVQNTCYLVKISYSGKVHTQKVMVSSN